MVNPPNGVTMRPAASSYNPTVQSVVADLKTILLRRPSRVSASVCAALCAALLALAAAKDDSRRSQRHLEDALAKAAAYGGARSRLPHPVQPLTRVAVVLSPRDLDDLDDLHHHHHNHHDGDGDGRDEKERRGVVASSRRFKLAHGAWVRYMRPILNASGIDHVVIPNVPHSPADAVESLAEALRETSKYIESEGTTTTGSDPNQPQKATEKGPQAAAPPAVVAASVTTSVLLLGRHALTVGVAALASVTKHSSSTFDLGFYPAVGFVELPSPRGPGAIGLVRAAWRYLFCQHEDAERYCKAALAIAYNSTAADSSSCCDGNFLGAPRGEAGAAASSLEGAASAGGVNKNHDHIYVGGPFKDMQMRFNKERTPRLSFFSILDRLRVPGSSDIGKNSDSSSAPLLYDTLETELKHLDEDLDSKLNALLYRNSSSPPEQQEQQMQSGIKLDSQNKLVKKTWPEFMTSYRSLEFNLIQQRFKNKIQFHTSVV